MLLVSVKCVFNNKIDTLEDLDMLWDTFVRGHSISH